MSALHDTYSPITIHRAFIVHFRRNSDVARSQLAGRVEHLVSGQAAHFDNLAELLAFIQRILSRQRAPPLPDDE